MPMFMVKDTITIERTWEVEAIDGEAAAIAAMYSSAYSEEPIDCTPVEVELVQSPNAVTQEALAASQAGDVEVFASVNEIFADLNEGDDGEE